VNPYEKGSAEERRILKRRIKELEAALKRSMSSLAKSQKDHALFRQQEAERHKEQVEERRKWRQQMEADVQQMRAETERRVSSAISSAQADERLKLVSQQDELSALQASLAEKAKKQAQQEKEERVELLRRQIARRMMHQGLIRGWTSWHASWFQKATRRRLLQKAAARLTKPARSAAWSLWRDSWQDAKRMRERKAMLTEMRQREAMLGSDATSLRAQIDRERAESQRRLRASEKAREELQQRLTAFEGGPSEAELQVQEILAKEAREKEKRVEHLCDMIARRMLRKDLTRGWTAWKDMWEEEARRKRMLTHACASLKNPDLTWAYALWKQMWQIVRKALDEKKQRELARLHARQTAALSSGSESLRQELERVTRDYERKLKEAKDAYHRVMDRLEELDGAGAEAARRHEEQIATEREKRIEHLCGMIARRMLKKDLTRGWAAWVEKWEEGARQQRMLARAAGRLRSPAVAAAWSLIKGDWLEAQRKAEREREERHRQREMELSKGAASMQASLSRVTKDYEEKLKASEEKYLRVVEKLAALDKGAAEAESRMNEQLEKEAKEREKRIEHLCGMIARRMLKKDITRGWIAWKDMWVDVVSRKRALTRAAQRLRNPELSAAFRDWKGLWQLIRQELSDRARRRRERAHQQRHGELQDSASALEAELKRTTAEYERKLQTLEADKQMLLNKLTLLDGGAAEMELKLQEQLEKERLDKEKRVEHLCGMIARRMFRKDLSRGWSAWFDLWEEQARMRRAISRAAQKLRNPEVSAAYSIWKEFWSAANAALEEKATMEKERAQKQREQELAGMSEEIRAELDRMKVDYIRKLNAKTREAETLQSELDRVREDTSRKLASINSSSQSSLDRERSAMQTKLDEMGGSVLEADRKLREQLAKEEAERQQRVEHLCSMIARRMLKKDLTRGWTTWLEMWEGEARRKRMIKHACASLKSPGLAWAFNILRSDWAVARKAALEKSQRLREAQMELGVTGLQSKLDRVTKEYEEKLQSAEAAQAHLMEKLTALDGGAAEAELKLQQQRDEAERENQKRVEHLCGMIARRMLKKDLARGWTAWCEQWQAYTHRKRQLAYAASRMKNPVLSEAYHIWTDFWYDRKRAIEEKAKRDVQRLREKELTGGATALRSELDRVTKEYERKLQSAEYKYQNLMDRLSELDGGAAAAEMRLQEQLAKEEADKQKRVEHLSGMIARRMLRKDLSRGWLAWVDMWEEKLHYRHLLRAAANKLSKPELTTAFNFIKQDWQEAKWALEVEAARQREAELGRTRGELQQELARVRQEYEHKLKLAEIEKQQALETQLAELLGDAEGEKAAQEAKAKEERVELLCRQMVRRMLYNDIIRGWTSWVDMWEEKTHLMRCMRKAGGRLAKPAMSSAFALWQQVNQDEKRAAVMRKQAARRAALEEQLRKHKLESGKLTLIHVANEDTIQALRTKVVGMSNDLTAKTAALMSAEEERKQFDQLQELHRVTQNTLTEAEKERDLARKHAKEEESNAKQLIKRLLAEQRASLEEELQKGRKNVKQSSEELKQAREDVARLEKEVARLKGPKKPAAPKKVLILSGDPNKSISEQIAEALKANSGRVLDLFRSWDADGDGEISRVEFHKAMPLLGLDVPKKAVDELFDLWDKDGGGSLAYKEMKRILSGASISTPQKKKVTLSGNGPLSDQLAEALKAQSGRVLDLFRSWDRDGDGEVSRKEFHNAVPALGLEVPKPDVDELFDKWDKDGGGSLAYKELKKILSGAQSPAAVKVNGTLKMARAVAGMKGLAGVASTMHQ
jgi:Ca2+-binding EF-hand superfamily protein